MSDAPRSHYRPEIDGLRALAVVAVIIHHLDKEILPSGFLGVDVFFVISGFVITTSIAKRTDEPAADFLAGFYQRRVKRLVPALLTCIGFSAVLICLLNYNPASSLKTGAASIFGFSNFFLFLESTDYFGARAELNIFTQTWSLGIEEQFYFIFPVLAWGLWLKRPTSTGDQPRKTRFVSVVAILSIASATAFALLWNRSFSFTYFMMPTRFWELGAGVLLYFLQPLWTERSQRTGWVPGIALGTVCGTFFFPISLGAVATPIAVLSTAILLVSTSPETWTYRLFTSKIAIHIGLISYSLYLWHWTVICVARWTVGVTVISAPFLMIAMFLCAEASFRFVEKPLRHKVWASSPLRTLSVSFVLMLTMLAIILCLYKPLRGDLYLGRILQVELPKNLTTAWTDPTTGEGRDPCMVHRDFAPELIERCLSPKHKSRRAFIVGDSHARNYLFAVKNALPSHETRHLTMGRGCALLPTTLMDFKNSFKVGCEDYVEEVRKFLRIHVKAGDVVVVGQRLFEFDPRRQKPAYFEFLSTVAGEITGLGGDFVLLDGVMPPAKYPNDCVKVPWRPFQTENSEGCWNPKAFVEQAFIEFDKLATSLALENPRIHYVSLRSALCAEHQCGQRTENRTPIWHDRGHITKDASLELGPVLREALPARLTTQPQP